MTDMTLKTLAKAMAKIDFAMLSTRDETGAMGSRPMSNNGEVEYSGDSVFFTYDSTRMVADITRDPQVGLTFTGAGGLLGSPPLFIVIQGQAELIRDKSAFQQHWTKGLERWFPQGIETPGLILIRVRAGRLHYWDGEDQGELVI